MFFHYVLILWFLKQAKNIHDYKRSILCKYDVVVVSTILFIYSQCNVFWKCVYARARRKASR